MILHTIISEEDIFPEKGNLSYSYLKRNNMILEGTTVNRMFIPHRIISTNPYDFFEARNMQPIQLHNDD